MATTVPVQKYETSFTIDVTGESTGDRYQGVFRVWTRLNARQRLHIDQVRRQLIGPQPEGAYPSVATSNRAEVLSNLSVRIIESPEWWTNSDGGLTLYDDLVAGDIYERACLAEVDAMKAIKKAGTEAQTDLREKGSVTTASTI